MQKTLKRIITKYLKKDEQKNNKGFTLVELIVVLVILAILAAILVPALLGYIDRAKQNQDILNARNFYTAAQTVATEFYAQGKPVGSGGEFGQKVLQIADLGDTDFRWGYIGFGNNTSDPNAHENYTIDRIIYMKQNADFYFMKSGGTWEFHGSSELPDYMTSYFYGTNYEEVAKPL